MPPGKKRKSENPLEGIIPAKKRFTKSGGYKRGEGGGSFTPIKQETAQHQQAFEYWANLGPMRTYATVGAYYHVSALTIRNWALSFHWKERLEQRGLGAKAEALTKYEDGEVSTPEELRRELKDMRVKLREVFDSLFETKGGKLVLKFMVEDVKDMGTLFKMYQQTIELDLRAQTVKKAGDEASKLTLIKKEINNFITTSNPEDRIALLTRLNELPAGESPADILSTVSLTQFLNGEELVDLSWKETEEGEENV